jgi:hypothetical protein
MGEAAFWTKWPVRIAHGCEGLSQLRAMRRSMPGRREGRRSYHREYHAVVEFLIFLHGVRPGVFPLTIEKDEAPDFKILPASGGRVVALEHTEATSEAFQEWEATQDEEVDLACSPGATRPRAGKRQAGTSRIDQDASAVDGWAGSATSRHVEAVLKRAVQAKMDESCWRHAPERSVRALLLSDATGAESLVDDETARRALQSALLMGNQLTPALQHAFLVRGVGRVMAARRLDA